ncbi:MAG TPA: glycosyltransferase family 4 protein [Mycobacteriales bacterium]|nr:glycosyltransferase family 4 protein [Mycobacteriales bacterium]
MADRTIRLLLTLAETTGGIGRHVALLAERLPQLGVEVSVAGPVSALETVGAVSDVVSHEIPVGNAVAARRALRPLVGDADVVHAHGLRSGVLAAAANRRTPVVVTWHNAPLVGGVRLTAHRIAAGYAARRADLTLGASPDLTAAARRAGARHAQDTFVVAPPLPPASRSREETRDDLQVGSRPMVLAIGRLQAQKRFDVLIDAAAGWQDRGERGPAVIIAGSGPDQAALKARAEAAHAWVRFLGARDDVADLLAAADVVVLASEWEARSLVAQEALRAGVPLVTTPVGGLPDLVGAAASFVPVGDPPALREAVLRLVGDADLRAQLATAGKARAATWPTVEESIAALAATYRVLLRD